MRLAYGVVVLQDPWYGRKYFKNLFLAKLPYILPQRMMRAYYLGRGRPSSQDY
jgi:hypothetical protein